MPHIRQLEHDFGMIPLSDADRNHLSRLTADWQVVSDLLKADLILWLPIGNGRFTAADHCRPATGVTIHYEDVLMLEAAPVRCAELERVMRERRVIKSSSLRWAGSYSVEESYVPVVREGRAIAAISVELNSNTIQAGDEAGGWTSQVATELCSMIATGEYPYLDMPTSGARGAPRVADGAIYMDSAGVVQNVTPNAHSAFLRLGVVGGLRGRILAELVTPILQNYTTLDESTPVVVMGKAAWQADLESPRAMISLRAMPLTRNGVRVGALLLCRDVTSRRRRDMQLLSKDATIREIHHRVKNNLQTVSALLRLQRRRSENEEVRLALSSAERRVATIASVHNALAHSVTEDVDFDDLVQLVTRMAASTAATEGDASARVNGQFGQLSAGEASALAVVIAELVTNAVEHGLQGGGGVVDIEAERDGSHLIVRVMDRGKGFDYTRESNGLGTQIVGTLVRGELRGTIHWGRRCGGGTVVTIEADVCSKKDDEAASELE